MRKSATNHIHKAADTKNIVAMLLIVCKGNNEQFGVALRQNLYNQSDHSFSPLELISEPWVAGQWKRCWQLPIGPAKH
eukprot:4160821-Amphidinium_carterae.1